MPSSVVCISRTVGAGGEQVGRLAAERLGFSYVDEEIITRAAEKGHIAPADVADAERRKSALRRLLEEMGTGSAVETYGLAPAVSGDLPDDTRALIREAIEEAAARGKVVIVAHAASFALTGMMDVLRVLVTASPKTRAQRLAEQASLAPKDAEKAIKESDAARADYLRRFYGVGAELPTHYDLVVNTDVLGVERAADLVAAAVS